MNKLLIICCFVFTGLLAYEYDDRDCDYCFCHVGHTIQSPQETYTLLNPIGAGAFGRVYRAECSSGDIFAIKKYTWADEGSGFVSLLADSIREYMRGQVLDHPNIIKSIENFNYDCGEVENEFTVLEYVSGETLSETPKGSLETEETAVVVKQLISGLRYAFHEEYLHLDLHTSNVMLSQNKQIKIIDLSSFFSFEEISDFFLTDGLFDYYYSNKESVIQNFANMYVMCLEYSEAASPVDAYFVSNLDSISEMCSEIIALSTASFAEKEIFQGRLNDISYSYHERLGQGQEIDFINYLKMLEEVLAEFNA